MSKQLDLESVEIALAKEQSVAAAARSLGVSRSMLRGFIERENVSVGRVIEAGAEATSLTWKGKLGRVDSLVKRGGLSIDEWEVSAVRLNEYGQCGNCGHGGLEQNRVDLKPRRDFLAPARADGWKAPKVGKITPSKGRIGLLPDQHAPRHDPALHRALCEWIVEAKPEKLVLLGDLLDNSSVSRHPKTGFEAGVQACLNAGYNILRDYAKAIEKAGMAVGPGGCEIQWIMGNHDQDRIDHALHRMNLSELAHLTQATHPDDDKDRKSTPALRLDYLMRLDELNVEAIFPANGDPSYKHGELAVTDDLLAVHGWVVKPGSGASALATLEKVRENVVLGHVHRQAIVFDTKWHRGEEIRISGCEAGTLALVEQNALSYAQRPNWQGGWAVAETFQGGVSFDLASSVNGQVLWRDNAFSM